MAIKLKAKETEIKVGEKKGEWRFVLSPEIYGRHTEAKVIKEAALRSGVMQACWAAAGEVIKAWATEGHSVAGSSDGD